jgi:hypothetical protein
MLCRSRWPLRFALGVLLSGSAILPAARCLLAGPPRTEALGQPSVVVRWNQAALDAIRISRPAPPVAARMLAITHTCIYDAWAAYDALAIGTQLSDTLRRPPSERTQANKEKAISFAAYRALSDLIPSQQGSLFDPLMAQLGFDPTETTEDPSLPSGVGNRACNAVLAFRHGDGSNQSGELRSGSGAYADYTGYSPANTSQVLRDPNRWQPLLVNGTPQRWLLPQWGMVTPFSLSSGAQLRPVALQRGPLVYPSPAFWKEALDVVELSAQLGDKEKVISEYWADGAGTFTPAGHWCFFAQVISRRQHYDVDHDVKLFFILTNALLDASIASWDVKRYVDSIRPVTVIRSLMGNRTIRAWAGPGLGVTTIDCKRFRPYLPTPAFGSFVSGHSTFSAAGAEVLKRFTGSDAFGESFTTEAGSSLIEPGLTPSIAVTLSWPTFSAAADEAGMSRRFGGIHFESDDLAGRALGRAVAAVAWSRALAYTGTLTATP